jgi:trans-aconitate 2-methyltransferase
MTYEFDGKRYEKASAHQKEWGAKLISEFAFSGTERILDLGCGDGSITERLAELVPDGFVLGIDASEGMIEAAQKKQRPNLSFQLMDINRLGLSETFDLVFSNATLHWIRNHRVLWENITPLLSPNGMVRFNFAADGNCSHFIRVIRNAMALPEYKSYFQSFDWPWFMPGVEEYRHIVEAFNFSQVKVWGENADRTFPDRESIVGWINQPSIVPFLSHVPEDRKEAFRSYVIEQMLKETAQPGGGYFETFRRINVLVTK